MKWLVVIAFILIVASLASALVALARPRPGRNMLRALTVRVGLSVTLFLLILLAYWLGWIESTGLPLLRR